MWEVLESEVHNAYNYLIHEPNYGVGGRWGIVVSSEIQVSDSIQGGLLRPSKRHRLL